MIKQAVELVERIKADDVGKHDLTVKVPRIELLRNGSVNLPNTDVGTQYGLTDHALGQLSTRLGIPTRYAKKCMETEPELFANHANFWLQTPEWEK